MAFIDPAIASFVATFLFVFALFFFLLEKTGFGDKNTRIILALAISFFAASYQPLVSGLYGILPLAVVLLIIITGLFFMKDVAGKLSTNEILPTAAAFIIALAVLAVIWDRIAPLLPSGISPDNVLYAAGIIIILMLLYVIQKQQA